MGPWRAVTGSASRRYFSSASAIALSSSELLSSRFLQAEHPTSLVAFSQITPLHLYQESSQLEKLQEKDQSPLPTRIDPFSLSIFEARVGSASAYFRASHAEEYGVLGSATCEKVLEPAFGQYRFDVTSTWTRLFGDSPIIPSHSPPTEHQPVSEQSGMSLDLKTRYASLGFRSYGLDVSKDFDFNKTSPAYGDSSHFYCPPRSPSCFPGISQMEDLTMEADSVKRKRKRKMNKHKHRKLRRRLRKSGK